MAKFALVTTLVEEFDSREALEHYVKEHAPFEFDDKVALLESNKVIIDAEDESTITVEILTEAFPGEDSPSKSTIEDEHTENAANAAEDGDGSEKES